MPSEIALVGDYSSEVIAHRAIPRALELARDALAAEVTWRWVPTRALRNASVDLLPFGGVWSVPASPYENMPGVLDAIRFVRETGRPFLGTCGGFQHAVIEFARHVAGIVAADHAETNPHAEQLVVTPLSCSLVEKAGEVRLLAGSLIRAAYARDSAHETYHCSYGVDAGHRTTLERAGLRFTACDELGDIRAAELPPRAHPFFVGTLFQPERAALRGEVPPLVRAFVQAVLKWPALGGANGPLRSA